MKRFITTFLILLFSSFLFSCGINRIEIPVGVEPTASFHVNTLIRNQMVFEENSAFKVSGTAETGVVIVAKLLNEKESTVFLSYCSADEFGVWSISFNAPAGSFLEYHLVIQDARGIYEKNYYHIRFGKVFGVFGDGFISIKNSNENFSPTANVFDYSVFNSLTKEFVVNYQDLSLFEQQLGETLASQYNMPILLIETLVEQSFLESWAPKEVSEKYKVFQNLISYRDEMDQENVSIFYDKMKYLKDISFEGIFFHQGTYELETLKEDIDKEEYFNTYKSALSLVLDNFSNGFMRDCPIYLLQDPAIDLDSISYLRNAQAISTFNFNMIHLILTYDLLFFDNSLESPVIYSSFFEGVIDRIMYSMNHKYDVTAYSRSILNYTKEDVLSKITIVFSDNIINYSGIINNLYVYNELNEKIQLIPIVEKDRLIFNLEYKNPQDTLGTTYSYYKVTRISFSMEAINLNNNLYDESGYPIVPFSINYRK